MTAIDMPKGHREGARTFQKEMRYYHHVILSGQLNGLLIVGVLGGHFYCVHGNATWDVVTAATALTLRLNSYCR